MKWVTRHHPKIDGLATPWLIRRFIDLASDRCPLPPPSQIIHPAAGQEANPKPFI